MPAIYHEGSWLGNATDPEVLVKDTVGWTGKNLLKNESSTTTHLGVTFTVNSDGSITANGTSTGVSNYVLVTDLSKYQGLGDLYLTGCPEDGGESKYEIIVCNSDGVSFYHSATDHTKVRDFGNGTSLNVDTIQSGNSTPVNLKESSIRILTRKNQTVNNLTFYPMIRKADITDPTYEPYHESVEEEIEQVYADNGVLGAKNLLPKMASKTDHGVTYTVDGAGVVTGNGTASEANSIIYVTVSLKAGEYILSGCPNGGSTDTYRINAYLSTSPYTNYGNDIGEGLALSFTTETTIVVQIVVKNGATISNLVFKPMVRLASDPDDTYQPYAMTNRELTDAASGKNLTISTTNNSITLGAETYCRIFGSIIIGSLQFTTSAEIAQYATIASIAYGAVPVNKGKFMFATISTSQDVYRVTVEAGNTPNMGIWVNGAIPAGKTCKFTFVLFV